MTLKRRDKTAEEAKGCGAPSPTLQLRKLLPAPRRKFMASGEHKLIRFAYYPSPHRDGSIDHRFVGGYADRWITAQVKIQTRKDEADAIRTRTELFFFKLHYTTIN